MTMNPDQIMQLGPAGFEFRGYCIVLQRDKVVSPALALANERFLICTHTHNTEIHT